jgi:hypothetical protein
MDLLSLKAIPKWFVQCGSTNIRRLHISKASLQALNIAWAERQDGTRQISMLLISMVNPATSR